MRTQLRCRRPRRARIALPIFSHSAMIVPSAICTAPRGDSRLCSAPAMWSWSSSSVSSVRWSAELLPRVSLREPRTHPCWSSSSASRCCSLLCYLSAASSSVSNRRCACDPPTTTALTNRKAPQSTLQVQPCHVFEANFCAPCSQQGVKDFNVLG